MISPILSIQMCSLRALDGLEAQLDVASRAGFSAVELLETQIADGRATRANLDVRNLVAPSVHVSLHSLRDRPGEVVAGARIAGAKYLVVPEPPFGDSGTDCQGWRALGRELGGLAARLIDAGLTLCYHNHDWEVQQLPDGTLPLDLLLEEGAEGGLQWQADVAWLVRGGADPIDWLDRYSNRLTSIHVKDIAAEQKPKTDQNPEHEDGWTDIGQGILDWQTLWAKCHESDADLMIAEHNKPTDPAAFARRSLIGMERLAARNRG